VLHKLTHNFPTQNPIVCLSVDSHKGGQLQVLTVERVRGVVLYAATQAEGRGVDVTCVTLDYEGHHDAAWSQEK